MSKALHKINCICVCVLWVSFANFGRDKLPPPAGQSWHSLSSALLSLLPVGKKNNKTYIPETGLQHFFSPSLLKSLSVKDPPHHIWIGTTILCFDVRGGDYYYIETTLKLCIGTVWVNLSDGETKPVISLWVRVFWFWWCAFFIVVLSFFFVAEEKQVSTSVLCCVSWELGLSVRNFKLQGIKSFLLYWLKYLENACYFCQSSESTGHPVCKGSCGAPPLSPSSFLFMSLFCQGLLVLVLLEF